MRANFTYTFLACVAMSSLTSHAEAQSVAPAGAFATRAELERTAAENARRAVDSRNAGERAQALADERALRDRLRVGDFRVGDRIVLNISGGANIFDTVNVSPTRALTLPDAGDVALDGLLRSELEQYLTAQVARYVRNTVVRAEPLMRLAVVGEVRSPGFVHVPARSLLSDVVSAAGGPSPNGSLERLTVRRGGRTLFSGSKASRALTSGVTLDELDLQAGDEVMIEAKRSFNWTQMIQTTAIIAGSAATLIAIRHR